MKNLYNKIYNEVEWKAGKLIAKDPKSIDKPEKVFEEASHIKLPKGVVVKLLKSKPNQIDIILPPDPKQVKQLKEQNNPLVEHFKSLFFNPNVDPEEKDKTTLQQIVSGRAWVDPEFMKKLKNDPKEALSETLRKKLPTDMSVKLYEETTDKVYLMVPSAIAVGGKLVEDELETVVGGVQNIVDSATNLFLKGNVESPESGTAVQARAKKVSSLPGVKNIIDLFS